MNALRSLAAGVRTALSRWPLLFPAYLAQLLLGLIAAAPATYLLYDRIDQRELAARSVATLPGSLLLDTFGLNPMGTAQAVTLALPAVGVAVLYALLAPFLRAGTLVALAAPQGVSLGYAFWTGIHRLGFAYLRLSLLLIPAWTLALAAGAFLGALSGGVVLAVKPTFAWRILTFAVPAILLGAVQTWAEYARIALIDAERPQVWQALVAGWRFFWRHPGKVCGLTMAMLLLGWSLLIGALAVEWHLPASGPVLPLLLAWQQVVILIRNGTQNASLAAYLHLYRTNP